jgi:eukaryotic-like serine/threonine-protein kinase
MSATGGKGDRAMGETARQVDALLESGEPRTIGRYVLYTPIARGGMATIHIARLVGDDGFSRIVAAKRLHPQFTEDPDFIEMFRDEAEIASKIRHPNVVPVLDIVLDGEEVVLVQEYVHGVPLDRLFRAACGRAELIAPRIVVGIVAGILAGLHSAHETSDEQGNALGIIHRDVSPQNILVSAEGIPRLLDFGIAKARSSAHVTRAGLLMGKIAYMPAEQVRGEVVTCAADIYSCGVVLWELLALRRLHTERTQAQILAAVLTGAPPALMQSLEPEREAISKERWALLQRLEPVVSRATALRPEDRYASAAEMLRALVRVVPAASALEVADWVKSRGSEYLERRQQVLARIEESWRSVSKIALTSSSVGGPESGVQRVREPSVVTAGRTSSGMQPASAMYVPMGPEELEIEIVSTRDRRLVPWAVAGASLLISAVLVGALFAARQAPVVAAPAAAPREPTAVVVAPPAAAVPEPAAPATSFLAPPMVATKAVRAQAAPPLRKPAVDLFATPLHTAPAPAIPTAALPPKTDCDPPFYFEGTKKIFKPSCI